MRFVLIFFLISSAVSYTEGRLFFPEEVVSFLSFVYSIIPPIKIGKDSRFGAGFRVGQNADFQVLVELGPQSETQPLGPDATNRREIRADRLNLKNQTEVGGRPKVKTKKIPTNNVTKSSTEESINAEPNKD